MDAVNFCYWLQGYMEVTQAVTGEIKTDHIAAKVINDHLQLVFRKETPVYKAPSLGQLPRTTTLPYQLPTLGDDQLLVTC